MRAKLACHEQHWESPSTGLSSAAKLACAMIRLHIAVSSIAKVEPLEKLPLRRLLYFVLSRHDLSSTSEAVDHTAA